MTLKIDSFGEVMYTVTATDTTATGKAMAYLWLCQDKEDCDRLLSHVLGSCGAYANVQHELMYVRAFR